MTQSDSAHPEPVVLTQCSSAEEVTVLGSLLQSEGIPYEVADDPDSLGALTGDVSIPAEGHAILVPAKFLKLAQDVLNRVKKK